MRLLFISTAMLTVLLARPAATQSVPPGSETATPSVLAPIMPSSLPPPTPIAPAATGQPPPDPGSITAVPLPPPTPAPTTTAAPLTPIPLTLPPLPPRAANQIPAGKPSPAPAASARLPEPPLSPEASPADFLRAARGAVAAGRTGEARSALEMAQTRLLDRSVDAGKENAPVDNLAVQQISEAISALAANDRMACLRYIEFASRTIGSPLD